MLYVLSQLSFSLDMFARAGGGGSSSGGGGGEVIALVGYVPMHFLGARVRKYTYNHDFWLLFQVVAWVICVIFALMLIIFLRGIGFLMAIGAVTGMGAGLYN